MKGIDNLLRLVRCILRYQAVLENFLLPFMDRWPEIDFVYQQDNAAIHVSNSTKQWFIGHNIETGLARKKSRPQPYKKSLGYTGSRCL